MVLRSDGADGEAFGGERADVHERFPPQPEVPDDLAHRRPLKEPVAGEPRGVEEPGPVARRADEPVVVGGDLVQPGPPVRDAQVSQRRGPGLDGREQRGEPGVIGREVEAGHLVLVGEAHQHARPLAVEVEGGGGVDGHRRAAGRQGLPSRPTPR